MTRGIDPGDDADDNLCEDGCAHMLPMPMYAVSQKK